jgi:hypothetical protein
MKPTAEHPAESADPILSGLAIQQREREATLHTLARLRKEASAEIERLIAFLDTSDPYVMNELELDNHDEDGGDTEPSLGSFDRMIDQSKSWRSVQGEFIAGLDAEQDDADREDADPAEESEPSGIGDVDGLHEQVGTQDWQHGAMG